MSSDNEMIIDSPKILPPLKRRSTNTNLNSARKSKNKLPENFHKKIVELENTFINNKTIDIMQELLNLYKVNY